MTDKTNPLSIEISLNVNTYDIDVAGHVNNIVYIRWLEDMRSLLFPKLYSLKKLLAVNHYLVVVSSEVKYRKQIKLFDKPVGKMLLVSYSHGILLFKTEITIDNHIAFNAIQKCVLINLKNNKMLKGDINDFAGHLER